MLNHCKGLRYSAPVADPRLPNATALAAANFWMTSPIPPGGWDYAFCILQRDAVLAAINKILSGRVKSYHVGSRGLEYLSLADLMEYLKFWNNAANDALLGVSSAIQSRRAVPCDV